MMRYCKLMVISLMLFTLTGCGRPQITDKVVVWILNHAAAVIYKIDAMIDRAIGYRPDFYNYDGFRDWDRFPLIYPYHIITIDGFDRGRLEEYIGGDIRDPNVSSKSVLEGDISTIILRDDCLIFKLEKPDREGSLYGIFDYRSGEVRRFKDIDSLRCALEPGFPLQFDSLKKAYYDYWSSPKKNKIIGNQL
ncbi:MAG: hypothetical protein IJS14_11265 [Lentisphaeria bacterium]|nr:hypothetical protein [Lentisphaeria bacterium]